MKNSAYSKMFLVLPSIYDKVLKCIDEKDQKVLDQLNIQKDEGDGSRASEKYFEDVASTELNDSGQNYANQSSEFIDPPSNIAEQTFGEDQNDQINIQPNDPDPNDPNDRGNIQHFVNNNPLKNDCAQPDVQDQFIPQVFQNRKDITKTKIVVPNILKKLSQKSPIKNVPRNFICNICTKPFKSTYHLKRHINAKHKDLVALSSQTNIPNVVQPSQQPIAGTSQPVVPQPGTSQSQFNNWQEQSLPLQGYKRDTTTANLKYSKNTNKKRPKDDVYDDWN